MVNFNGREKLNPFKCQMTGMYACPKAKSQVSEIEKIMSECGARRRGACLLKVTFTLDFEFLGT